MHGSFVSPSAMVPCFASSLFSSAFPNLPISVKTGNWELRVSPSGVELNTNH